MSPSSPRSFSSRCPGPGSRSRTRAPPLYGAWLLVSFEIKIVGEDGPPQELFGARPFGRIIFTPDHFMTAFLSSPDRRPPSNEADATALLSSMIAYTGKFRLEGDSFITTVDGAWNEIIKANDQVRYFTIDGDKLSIRTPEQPSALIPGKRTTSALVWQRER